MEVYKRAKDKVFKEFNITKWEDIPATKYNSVQAFIEECLWLVTKINNLHIINSRTKWGIKYVKGKRTRMGIYIW